MRYNLIIEGRVNIAGLTLSQVAEYINDLEYDCEPSISKLLARGHVTLNDEVGPVTFRKASVK